MTAESEVAWIFCQEEQTSVVVGHQQTNDRQWHNILREGHRVKN